MSDWVETIILIGGVYNLAFAIFHIFFWRLFGWKKDLRSLTFINRQVMQILNLCLTFVFMVMAYVSFAHATELIGTRLGRSLLIAFSSFWFLRAIEQMIFFSLRRWESLAFTVVFMFGSGIYLLPVIQAD